MILVTGATGNIGRDLVQQLLDNGQCFRVLVRDERKVVSLFGAVDCAIGDLNKIESLCPAMQGVDKLFMVTPETKQVANLLQAAKQAGVKHIVKVSTIEADRSIGPGKWHRQQEELIQSMGFSWTILRPTMMMVNIIDWWGGTIKSQNAVYFPGGKGKVAPVDARDVAAVARAVLTESGHNGKIYELTGPESLAIGEMVTTLGKVLKKPILYRDVPILAAVIGMLRFKLPVYLVVGLIQTLRALRHNDYAYVTDVVEKVGKCKPRNFEDWCRENIAAFQ